jgi:cytochrome c553
MKASQVNLRWLSAIALAAVGLAAQVACTTDTAVAASAAVATAAPAEPDQCVTCHRNEAKSWKEVYHTRVAQPPHESLIREAKQYWSTDARGTAGPTRGNVDGKEYTLADVQIVVGTRWKQRFLVKNGATGHHQFLDKQWNSYTRRWEDYANRDDWEGTCVACHEGGGKAGSSAQVDGTAASSGDL